MSNHTGSYMLNEVLLLLEEYDFFSNLTQEEILKFAHEIVTIGCRYDCNNGEIFDEIGKRLNYCYACAELATNLDEYGVCKECR